MKKISLLSSLAVGILMFASCDDTTDEIGTSLIDRMDNIEVSTDTFTLTSRSIVADSVYSRNTIGYLGKVRDPETGTYITNDYMTQFHIPEDYAFPAKDSIRSLDSEGKIIADSCELRLYFDTYYGDSLASMKLTAYEMSTPFSESEKYYSSFDPLNTASGSLVRTDFAQSKVYSLADLTISEEARSDEDYLKSITVPLDKEYTDSEGNTYNNFGTYVMRKYYENPDNFKNSYKFIHNVVPGFYFKAQSGLGSMAYITASQLNIYFSYSISTTTSASKDTVYTTTGAGTFAGTEEVLQFTHVGNDQSIINKLADDNTCTYLKTPAGIFTELTLPVEDIMKGHESDSLNTAKVVLTRINNNVTSDYSLPIPQTLLLIPASQKYSFFENNKVADYKTSFIATYNSTYNTYTFSNIGSLIKTMSNSDRTDDEWNKVVVIPVTTTYNSSSELVKVSHDMSMSSTRLVGGSENPYAPLKISVIYSHFK